MSNNAFRSGLAFFGTEAAFLALFTLVIIGTAPQQSTSKRLAGLAVLCAATVLMESLVVRTCLENERPHWAATAASLLWVQFLSASDLLLVARVHHAAAQPAPPLTLARGSSSQQQGKESGAVVRDGKMAVGLLWNLRRVGTVWQVKNVPSSSSSSSSSSSAQSRVGFVLRRVAVTVLAYLFVDAVVSMPPPEQAMVQTEKADLFSWKGYFGNSSGSGGSSGTIGDLMFRCGTVIGYWLTTGILNLFMNNVGAIATVLLGVSSPGDWPPLYGSFAEAYTIRRFWGISWHQMFRSFLTGHANLFVDTALPLLVSRRHHLHNKWHVEEVVSRYTRLMIAFLISGLIHYHADQLMGVPDTENGAVVFFLLHAAFIMLEDALGPVVSAYVLPGATPRLRRVLGYLWVFAFFVWTSPIWIYSGMRLGIRPAALLPIRVVGPWIEQSLGAA